MFAVCTSKDVEPRRFAHAKTVEQAARIYIRCLNPSPRLQVRVYDSEGTLRAIFYAKGRLRR
jgi:hypothetical protein